MNRTPFDEVCPDPMPPALELGVKRRPKLQGDAPLTQWELDQVRRDVDRAHQYAKEHKRAQV